MCVHKISEVKVAEEDMTVYKVVRKLENIFYSRVAVYNRVKQAGFNHSGTLLKYEIGVPIHSIFDNSPGLYTYVREQDSLETSDKVLKCTIPKGTKYKTAETEYEQCILTETLIPVEVL